MQHEVEERWSSPVLGPADVIVPTTFEELLTAAAAGRRPFAGGTDLLVSAAQSGDDLPPLVWTGAAPELLALEEGPAELRIGAAATLGRVASWPAARALAPALGDAAALVGSVQIRNVATLAGNLCNASPAADTVPALVVHAARALLRHADGRTRTVAVDQIAVGPGTTVLRDGELVAEIVARTIGPGEGSAYRRFTVRSSMDLAFVGVAARVAAEGSRILSATIALGAVAPTVIVAEEASALLAGAAPDEDVLSACGRAAAAASSPITDLRASAGYRRRLVEVLVGDVVMEAWRRAGGAA